MYLSAIVRGFDVAGNVGDHVELSDKKSLPIRYASTFNLLIITISFVPLSPGPY